MFLNIVKSILIMSLLTACGGDDDSDDNKDGGREPSSSSSSPSENNDEGREPSNTSSSPSENNDDGHSSLTEEEEGDESSVQESNDKVAPVITISGDNPLVISQGETFSDPGATATDDVDGVITVTPTGSVDMSTAGDYTITYTATDKAGNKTTATRTIIVKSASVVWNVSTMTEFRQALEDASANGENDKIVLSKGTYDVTSDGLGTLEFSDNEAFDLTIEALEGLTNKDVILSGNHSSQVFSFNNTEESTLILKNISVTEGNTTKNGVVYTNHNIQVEGCNISNNSGGGFYSKGTTTVTDSTISNNSRNGNGGGFYSNGATIVTDSTISDNSSDKGGGFYSGDIIVTNSTINNNKGGGFYSHRNITVTDSTINSNEGGGFHSERGITKVTNSTINDNKGGGFYSWVAIVINSTINNNEGGGFSSRLDTTVTHSTINNNKNKHGSGGFESGLGGRTTVTNSIINNNIGWFRGGGFYSGSQAIVVNSTISHNTLMDNYYTQGGGFYSDSAIVINSIFSGNSAMDHAIFYARLSTVSNNTFTKNKGSIRANGIFVNNIFSENDEDISLNGESKIYNNYIDYYKIEDNNENVIKKKNLQPASVGEVSLTATYGLTSSSPVIDKGLNPSSATYRKIIDNNDTYNQIIELLKTDNVGNRRVHNGTIDMGAVEYGSGK